jgi:peptide-methionine (R)-S-oxide reductase
MKSLFIFLLLSISVMAYSQDKRLNTSEIKRVEKSDEEWKNKLTEEEYYILRQKGTERPFTGKYYDFYEKGHYVCAACGLKLFDSDSKYSSGCGWPSFSDEMLEGNIKYNKDTSHGMIRTEILCAACDGHLGHVFNDGPPPTGLRYCVNSASVDFVKETE